MKHGIPREIAGAVLAACILLTAACSPIHYTEAKGEYISLYFKQADAEKVIFASSIDQYRYHPAEIVKDDIWGVTVAMQEEFDYFYIVDGVVSLPDCKLTVKDDFGSKNCLYVSRM